MKKQLQLFILLFISLSGFSQTTMENFSYGTTVDTLTNPANGGVNWRSHSGTRGSFTSSLIYNTTSLTYTGYSSSGIDGSIEVWGTTRSEDANRLLPIYNSGSVYASFLVKVDSVLATSTVGDYFFHFCDTFGTSALPNLRARFFVKMGGVAGTFNVGLNKGSAGAAAVFTTANYPFGTTLLVVMKYKFDVSAALNDSVFAHVFTSGVPVTEPSVPTLVATDVSTVADLNLIRTICIRQGSTANFRARVDGIRVASSWVNSALPVQFTNFSAGIVNNQTLLSWTTASETNNKGFEIQQSLDGKIFETIGFVKGIGNSSKTNSYSFTHNNNLSAYYRLNQIDFDGNSEYSDVVSVVNKEELVLQVTPNPFANSIEVVSNKPIVSAEIIDITGKIKMMEVINGNSASINTNGLSNGIYFIRINNGESIITKRIIKN